VAEPLAKRLGRAARIDDQGRLLHEAGVVDSGVVGRDDDAVVPGDVVEGHPRERVGAQPQQGDEGVGVATSAPARRRMWMISSAGDSRISSTSRL